MSVYESLTEKQRRFVDEYVVSGHITNSALAAGYSKVSAHSIGSENMQKPEIKAAIKERQREMKEELRQQFSRDAIEARKIMYDIMKQADVDPKVRVQAAKDLLDRGGFKPTDNLEISGPDGNEIKVSFIDPD